MNIVILDNISDFNRMLNRLFGHEFYSASPCNVKHSFAILYSHFSPDNEEQSQDNNNQQQKNLAITHTPSCAKIFH